MSWLVARVDVHTLPAQQRDAALGWVTGLGVDRMDVMPTMTVSSKDGQLRLHLSRFVRDEHGEMTVDHNLAVMATEPLVLDIDAVPDWLKEYLDGHVRPDQPVQHVQLG